MEADAVAEHYGSTDICQRINEALLAAGVDRDTVARSDLAAFDEFHGGGIASTRDLATYAGLTAGMRLVDIGCGIGGPARTLAAEFGCHVTGIDLTPAFVLAAQMLTAQLGMQNQCEFHHGSATALPLPDASCDGAWSQNMMMNVADKATFFAQVSRVLRPHGVFAFEAVLRGNGQPLHFPAFWAAQAEINFLVSREELENLLDDCGFERIALEETTAEVLAQAYKRKAAIAERKLGGLSIAVIVPADVELKMANAVRNNEEGRTTTIKGVYRKRA